VKISEFWYNSWFSKQTIVDEFNIVVQVLLWREMKVNRVARVGIGLYTVPEFAKLFKPSSPAAATETLKRNGTAKPMQ